MYSFEANRNYHFILFIKAMYGTKSLNIPYFKNFLPSNKLNFDTNSQ